MVKLFVNINAFICYMTRIPQNVLCHVYDTITHNDTQIELE
jgi:hypothetical protein